MHDRFLKHWLDDCVILGWIDICNIRLSLCLLKMYFFPFVLRLRNCLSHMPLKQGGTRHDVCDSCMSNSNAFSLFGVLLLINMKCNFIFIVAEYMHLFNRIIFSLLRVILFMIFSNFALFMPSYAYYRFSFCFLCCERTYCISNCMISWNCTYTLFLGWGIVKNCSLSQVLNFGFSFQVEHIFHLSWNVDSLLCTISYAWHKWFLSNCNVKKANLHFVWLSYCIF
jgi:hypothetical protein